MTTAAAAFGDTIDRRRSLHIAAVLVAACLLSASGAAYPQNTWLQVGPVMAFALAIPFLGPRFALSAGAWRCITAFLLVHLFAAHWTYSDVPYDRWLSGLGIHSSALFGTNRNMFDRLVHFTFGALAVRPLLEMEVRWAGLSVRSALRVALLMVLASSALYEIFEWSLAILLSPESAEAYNGQQGDNFDSQKDMLAAFVGALAAFRFARPARD